MTSTIGASTHEQFLPEVAKQGFPTHSGVTFHDFNDASVKTSPAMNTPSTPDQNEYDNHSVDHGDPIVIVGMGKLLFASHPY